MARTARDRCIPLAVLAGVALSCAARQRPAPAAPTAPVEIASVVAALSREAEAIRGLAFVHPVASRVEAPASVLAHFRAELAAEHDESELEQRVGIALGVVAAETGPDAHAGDAAARMIADEAQGYYDPDEATLVLPEDQARQLRSPGPAGLDARATVVHELVHALQQQHFAARFRDDADAPPSLGDVGRARLALLEGDATLVTLEWTERHRGGHLLGTADFSARVARWTERAQLLTESDVPRFVGDALEQPYETGTLAVAELYRVGGWSRVDAALADDGLRAAELLHPSRPATDYASVDPPAIRQGFTRVTARSLGELELRLYALQVMRPERAADATAAWRGDVLALDAAADGSGLAVQWIVECADPAAATRLADALAPMRVRWHRDGCAGIHGGCAGASITASGTRVVIARG